MSISIQIRVCILAFLLTGLLTAPAHSQALPAKKQRLTRKIKQKLERQILPAIETGDHPALLDCLLPIINSSSKQLPAIEAFCRDNNHTSVRKAFADALLAGVEQGIDVGNAINTLDAAYYAGDEILSRLQSRIESIQRHDVMKTPLVVHQKLEESEALFWRAHVLQNDLSNDNRLIGFNRAIVDKFEKKLNRADQGREFVSNFEKAEKELASLTRDFKERSIELRLQRFNWATTELNTKQDFKSQFTATMYQAIDGEIVADFLAKNDSPNRTALSQQGLAKNIQQTLKETRAKNGKLAQKAQLFRNGMHYWFRGRYGAGPLTFGMLKHPDAINSKSVMQSLYMPRQRPKPISAYHGDEVSSEGYDRRHLFTWAAEYRPLEGKLKARGSSSSRKKRSVDESNALIGQKTANRQMSFL